MDDLETSRNIRAVARGQTLSSLSLHRDCARAVVGGRDVLNIVELHPVMKVQQSLRTGSNKVSLLTSQRGTSVGSSSDGMTLSITECAWNPLDDDCIASGSRNCAVVIWSGINRGKGTGVVNDHHSPRCVTGMTWHPCEASTLFTSSTDGTLAAWDMRCFGVNQRPHTITHVPALNNIRKLGGTYFSEIQCNPVKTFLLAAAEENGHLCIFDSRNIVKPVYKLWVHTTQYTLDWHPQIAEALCTGSKDHTICIWDLHRDIPLHLSRDDPVSSSLAHTPNAEHRTSSPAPLQPIQRLHTVVPITKIRWQQHKNDSATSLCLTSLATISLQGDRDIRIWNVRGVDQSNTREPVLTFHRVHQEPLIDVQWLPNDRLLSCAQDGWLTIQPLSYGCENVAKTGICVTWVPGSSRDVTVTHRILPHIESPNSELNREPEHARGHSVLHTTSSNHTSYTAGLRNSSKEEHTTSLSSTPPAPSSVRRTATVDPSKTTVSPGNSPSFMAFFMGRSAKGRAQVHPSSSSRTRKISRPTRQDASSILRESESRQASRPSTGHAGSRSPRWSARDLEPTVAAVIPTQVAIFSSLRGAPDPMVPVDDLFITFAENYVLPGTLRDPFSSSTCHDTDPFSCGKILVQQNRDICMLHGDVIHTQMWEMVCLAFESRQPEFCHDIIVGFCNTLCEFGDILHCTYLYLYLLRIMDISNDELASCSERLGTKDTIKTLRYRAIEWVTAYIERLDILGLHAIARSVVRACPQVQEVRDLTRIISPEGGTSGYFHLSCSCGGRMVHPLQQRCARCGARMHRCVICEQTTRGLYVTFYPCGHGGCLTHVELWLATQNRRIASVDAKKNVRCPRCRMTVQEMSS